ncbi:MAG TPA: hypothetical protein VIS06_08150 [Mycobacteriales bacterium]
MAEPVTRLFPAPKDLAHIGASDVEQVNLLRLHSHEFERLMGGGAISGAAMVRRFRTALDALRGVYRDETVRQDMHAAVAHLGCTTGWILVEQASTAPHSGCSPPRWQPQKVLLPSRQAHCAS